MPNALQSLADGSRTGKREQRVYTPQCIVDLLLALWPEGIACDPCSGPESLVPAQVRVEPPFNGCRYATRIRVDDPSTKRGYRYDPIGPLVLKSWPRRTYINPPFGDLVPWIRQFLDDDTREALLLVPVRTHRKWWRPLLRRHVLWLDPLEFVGYEAGFPVPLALVYRGLNVTHWYEVAKSSGLGEVIL